MRTVLLMSVCVVSVLAGACGRGPGAGANTPAPSWLIAEAPEGAVGVAAVKAEATEGQSIIVRGRIGGRKDPISTEAAVFIIMDESVPSCAEIPGDTCPTPWDYCCEPSENLTANSATVQIVDEHGHALRLDVRRHGLAPQDRVIVIGTVASRPTQETLVIRAQQVHKIRG